MHPETFGLPPCLHVPIAAANLASIEENVGRIIAQRVSRSGRVNALLVETRPTVAQSKNVPLWTLSLAAQWHARLFPGTQVWVHVDYHGYRAAWRAFGQQDPGADFLDHVSNRRATRIRGAHPYLRLCPVSVRVNTSGGGRRGGESMEYEFWKSLGGYSPEIQEEAKKANKIPWVLADPMDLTKMLDIPPGQVTLDGVRDFQDLFFPTKPDSG